MPLAIKSKPSWEERAARADELATTFAFAAPILNFYREVLEFQKGLHQYLSACNYGANHSNGRLPSALDFFVVLPRFQSFIFLIERVAPEELAQAARELEADGASRWEELLQSFWHADENTESHPQWFFANAFLQPLAEYLAERSHIQTANYTRPVCPFCGRKPVVGVLRPEGDGAKRSLVCSLCSTEWQYRRVVCPSCEEERVEHLPVYTADQLEHVRVEACETCKHYIKTVDLTKTGLAVPLVDELATLPLNLWAQEKGYSKLQPNLLGI
jgi:FdhE protein